MKLLLTLSAALMCGSVLAAPPSFEEFSGKIRRDHPCGFC